MREPPEAVAPRAARAQSWLGLALLILPLPVMAVTEADLDALPGDWDDLAQAIAFGAPFLGYPLLVAGRYRLKVARDADTALPNRFDQAPGLRWIAGYSRSFLPAAVAMVLGIAVTMLAVAGLTALFTDGAFNFDDQPYGALGEGVLALAISLLLTTVAWMLLGMLLYGGLVVGYSLWRLSSRSAEPGEKSAAGQVMAAVLIVGGITLLAVAGVAGLPAEPVVVRGLMATAGMLLLVIPMGYAVTVARRQGHRPWGFTGRPDSAAKIVVTLGRMLAGVVQLAMLTSALLRAWQP